MKWLRFLPKFLALRRSIQRARRQGKPWYKSKTVWVNVVALIASLLSFKGIELTPEEQAYIATTVLAVVNIILRFVTDEPIVISKVEQIEEDNEADEY